VYAIEAKYKSQISDLEDKIADLKAAEHKELAAVLTAEQKKHLDEILTGEPAKPDPTPAKDKDKAPPADKDKP
jgi:hypothetical protein